MKRRAGSWLWVVALLTAVVLGSRGARGDILVGQHGQRFVGHVREEGDAYVLTLQSGGTMRFPKSVVREVITVETARASYEVMLQASDLADDAQVDKLAAFVVDSGLVEEQSKLLAAVYVHRRRDAEGKPEALLVLAKWCLAHDMAAEVAQCLADDYSARRQQATTTKAKWSLAKWCDDWKVSSWGAQQRLAAIAEAESQGDETALLGFLDELKGGTHPSAVTQACVKGIHRLRLQTAGQDAMAHAKLAAWCRTQGLGPEADAAEATALRFAPDDPRVRQELNYVRDPASGRWVKHTGPEKIEAGPWEVEVLSLTLTDSYSQTVAGHGSVQLSPTVPGTRLAMIEVSCKALRGYTPAESGAIA